MARRGRNRHFVRSLPPNAPIERRLPRSGPFPVPKNLTFTRAASRGTHRDDRVERGRTPEKAHLMAVPTSRAALGAVLSAPEKTHRSELLFKISLCFRWLGPDLLAKSPDAASRTFSPKGSNWRSREATVRCSSSRMFSPFDQRPLLSSS
jgi:hypothetical protein